VNRDILSENEIGVAVNIVKRMFSSLWLLKKEQELMAKI
jgi:hypothetical protein